MHSIFSANSDALKGKPRMKTLWHTILYYNNICITEACLLWEPAINSLSGPGLCSAEWQMTRFKVLLLVVMVLWSITHTHLAWILYVWQSNNTNICKLNLEVLYMMYLNKMYITEPQSILTASRLGVRSEKYYDQHFSHFLRFWSYAPKLLTFLSPAFRNCAFLVCT